MKKKKWKPKRNQKKCKAQNKTKQKQNNRRNRFCSQGNDCVLLKMTQSSNDPVFKMSEECRLDL